jgi:hypothetical protein
MAGFVLVTARSAHAEYRGEHQHGIFERWLGDERGSCQLESERVLAARPRALSRWSTGFAPRPR